MSSWNVFNRVLEGFKKFPLFKLMYRIPWAPYAYHFTLALLGAVIYGFPSRRLTVIGVTGTKGKTTVLELINVILETAGEKTALFSSVRIKLGDASRDNLVGNTQPGRFYFQYFLREAVRRGCKYALLEVTSEGVSLSRHKFTRWSVALITNIAPEHIEAHGSFKNYREAKLKFLEYAARGRAKVFLNGDDERSTYFFEKLRDRDPAAYAVEDLVSFPKRVLGRLPGDFNKENIAGAVAVVRALGVDDEVIETALSSFKGVPGRMEFIQKKPFAVVVDYAHTPDSLEAVYKTLKGEGGRLICVLGSMGGSRDKWKRPKLGEIASEHCSRIILTNEDPVNDDPTQILSEIKSGIQNDKIPMSKVYEIIDREEAIEKAVGFAKNGDTVVITGKGSELYIRVADGRRIDWSDKEVVKKVLAKKK